MQDAAESLIAKDKKNAWIRGIDVAIVILTVSVLMYTFIWNPFYLLKCIVGITALFCFYMYALKKSETPPNGPQAQVLSVQAASSSISKLAMLSEDGEKMKEWYIQGETALLIGKSSTDNEVEVDLADAEYASLISKQHAVLNYASGIWYLEDLDSRNGVGIKRKGASTKQVLENEAPYKIDSGDMIYIANTRLLVQ
ncbi:FHA domain-containing protein [Paenibacillus alba]|uniref:FHA domain-containing protein n=1 Tax=Paenibacillus alba TaxID=1197127 RepID=A0ABU6FX14_9BACL|nr:FHA domain-containing protein [Paenibacillus alba]MEC0226290.1 FHA domain-containing protein [Paenibacillus alba]